MHKLNILVAGKSGVGKSSLLNYIIGDNTLFKTGEGSPVTQDYFNKEIFKANGVEYHLFDTKGVEPDSTEEFSEELTQRIAEYRNNPDVFEHIHTLYYCFGASNKRIEPFEISFIKEMLEQLDVVIVLTKSDLITDQVKEELNQEFIKIFGSDIKVISVCSVSKKLRIGEVKPFGKEEFLKHAFMGLWNTFSKHVPNLYNTVFFSKEICLDFEEKGLRRAWYKFFGSEGFVSKNRTQIFFNLFTYFRLHEFCSDYFEIYNTQFIKFITNILTRSEELIGDNAGIDKSLDKLIIDFEENYRKIHDFYTLLTNESIAYKPLTRTVKKLHELSQFFTNSDMMLSEVQILNSEYLPQFKYLENNSSFWGGDERQLGERFYDNYLSILENVHEIIKQEIEILEEIYHTELYQFGDILIKKSFDNQKQEDNLGFIGSISELSIEQKIYYKKLKTLLESKIVINTDVREKLDFLREALNISYSNAGSIEDYARKY